jgi:hypothetical protein
LNGLSGAEAAAAHSAHADKYRAVPWHSKPSAEPPPLPDPDFPCHVHCADGIDRTANTPAEKAALEAIQVAVAEPSRLDQLKAVIAGLKEKAS